MELEDPWSVAASWVESSFRLECHDVVEGTDDAVVVSHNEVGGAERMVLALGSLR